MPPAKTAATMAVVNHSIHYATNDAAKMLGVSRRHFVELPKLHPECAALFEPVVRHHNLNRYSHNQIKIMAKFFEKVLSGDQARELWRLIRDGELKELTDLAKAATA